MKKYVRLRRAHDTKYGDRFEAGTIGEVLKETPTGLYVVCELLKPDHVGRVLTVRPEHCEIIDPEKLLLLF